MRITSKHSRRVRRSGIALVLVLIFLVLLAAVILALFARVLFNGQISEASANFTKADIYAHGSIEQVIGDLRQEIVQGSTSTAIYTDSAGVQHYIYRPSSFAASAPSLSGSSNYGSPSSSTSNWNAVLLNLVKESTYNEPFYPTVGSNSPSRAAPVSTSNDTTRFSQSSDVVGTSRNGHYINMTRWNEHLLLPRAKVTLTQTSLIDSGTSGTSLTDITPTSTFLAPDWVLTAANGTNPTTLDASMTNPTSGNYVVGRYAYAIYNEGGLLDANVAGSPVLPRSTYPPNIQVTSTTGTATPTSWQKTIWSHKGPESFADLTQLPGISNMAASDQLNLLDTFLGWRNNASLQASGTFPSYSISPNGFTNYLNVLLGLSTRFVTPANTDQTYKSGLMDQFFTNRQQMISFFENWAQNYAPHPADQAYVQDAMMYLTPFSRSLNQPSYWPDPNRPKILKSATPPSNSAYGMDDKYNPPFKSIRVTTSFARNDGSTAAAGEPLVKKRFALSRLCWISYKGPSASLSSTDPYITALLNNSVPLQLIQEGTASNIQKYFGLNWHAGSGTGGIGGYWTYDIHVSPASSSLPAMIETLRQAQAENREPNFFELLQAAICCGSLGNGHYLSGSGYGGGTADPPYPGLWQYLKDAQVSLQVIQIGANIIEQASPAAIPVLIVFNDGIYIDPCWGDEDLPYFMGAANVGVVVTDATPPAVGSTTDTIKSPGLGACLTIPFLWNPKQLNTTSSFASGLYPTHLRISVSSATLEHPAIPAATLEEPFGPVDDKLGNSMNSAELNPWGWGIINSPLSTGYLQFGKNDTQNTFIYFTNNSILYREPTPLLRWPTASTGTTVATGTYDSNNVISLPAYGGNAAWTTGIPELNPSNPNLPVNYFVGFLQGTYPLRHNYNGTMAGNVYTFQFSENDHGETYLLEYQDPQNSNGPWFPYQQYDRFPSYNWASNVPATVSNTPTSSPDNTYSLLGGWPPTMNIYNIWESVDPRTNRWAILAGDPLRPFVDSPANSMIQTLRPTAALNGGESAGASTQNLTSVTATILDPDGITRRAMGGYASTSSTTGLPMATVYNNTNPPNYIYNRPVILHRPFQSVAELGYVFSDTPWRNIDFFSTESGFGGLLDVFCINEDHCSDAVAAGQVDLNSRQIPVFTALLAGAYRDELVSGPAYGTGSGTYTSASSISLPDAQTMAIALVGRTTGTTTGKGPFLNVADLVGRYASGFSNDNGQPYDGYSHDMGQALSGQNAIIQRFRESTMRALSDAGQAGTWNLLIDVIAQSGRYPSNAANLADFLVEGERHYWVHVAIDRTTGDIIDKNVEAVNE